MKPGSSLILALVAVAALLLPRHGQAQAGCQFARIAEWPLKAGQEGFRFDGEINGKPAVFEIATDNATTFIWRSSLERLGLEVRKEGRFMVGGRRSGIVDLGELRIGPTVRKGFQAAVVGGPGPEGKVTVILGNDYFEGVDVELDLPGGAVRLFRTRDCESTSIAYWAKDGAGSVPLESDPVPSFQIQVNGQPLLASLNTLMRYSLLEQSSAEKLGIDRQAPGAAATGCETMFFEEWDRHLDRPHQDLRDRRRVDPQSKDPDHEAGQGDGFIAAHRQPHRPGSEAMAGSAARRRFSRHPPPPDLSHPAQAVFHPRRRPRVSLDACQGLRRELPRDKEVFDREPR